VSVTTTSFADRVMAAVALEPVPSPARSLVSALRSGSWPDAAACVRTAWHLSTVRAWHVAPAARVRAIALVLAVLMALGGGGVLAAGAVVRLASGLASTAGTGSDLDGLIPPGHPTPTQAPSPKHRSSSPTERTSPAQQSPAAVPSPEGKADGSDTLDRSHDGRDSRDNETGDDGGSGPRSPDESGGGDSGDGEDSGDGADSGSDDGTDHTDDSVSVSSPQPTYGGSSDGNGEFGDD
jgi:uncharacterized membrane protein YgcG